MKCYSYVIPRDFGFAPNPFYGICTLATCKPKIRESASIGDWIIGCGAAANKKSGFLVYAMQVNRKLDFINYWNSREFARKKPVMNGSLKQMYGDNIYHYKPSQHIWIQSDSHHSHEDGTENERNKKRDLSSKYVLISSRFWYFGGKAVDIPKQFKKEKSNICCCGIGHRINDNEDLINKFIYWLENLTSPGFKSDPLHFTKFSRYKGEP